MRRFSFVLAVLAASVASVAPADAAPTIQSATIEGTPLEGLTVVVTARDPDAAVNAVHVAFGEGEGGFGESACRIGRDGKPHPAGRGRAVRFEVPFEPTLGGAHELTVTVVSGACGGEKKTTSVSLPYVVTTPGLPTTPDPEVPLLPLPALPGVSVPPLARAAQSCPDAELEPAADNIKRIRAATLCLINQERAAKGLARLRSNRFLRRAAVRHSKDMLARRYFEHEGPHGPGLATRLKKVRYWPASASENLGAAQGVLATPATIIDAWMHSTSHRSNILNASFRHVGLGIIAGTPQGGPGATYTVDFGRR